jgi:hypothetical protein
VAKEHGCAITTPAHGHCPRGEHRCGTDWDIHSPVMLFRLATSDVILNHSSHVTVVPSVQHCDAKLWHEMGMPLCDNPSTVKQQEGDLTAGGPTNNLVFRARQRTHAGKQRWRIIAQTGNRSTAAFIHALRTRWESKRDPPRWGSDPLRAPTLHDK